MTKMKFNFFRISTVIVILFLLAWNGYRYFTEPKIAYVRSHDLIEKYQGTVEARSEFEKKKNGMVSNVDSLKMDFERAKNHYIGIMNSLSLSQRIDKEKTLSQQQAQLVQYSQVVDQKIQEEDGRMMQEVLNQVNSFVEEYAIREGYSVVLGTTSAGNLLYGEKEIDITDQLIVALNNRYKGK